jgi:dTDP-4-amino-4,6-dideoxygalactose transaminase
VSEHADMTILSFHPVKHVATGEGGMVLTDREDLYRRLILFRTHGITRDAALLQKNEGAWYYEMQELGYNYRITDLQCALGTSQMKKLDHSLFRRNEIARFYREEMGQLDWLQLPECGFNTDWLADPAYRDLAKKPTDLHAYHLFPVRVRNAARRKDFFDHLRGSGIFVQVHYIPLHLMPYYRESFGFKPGDFPKAERFYEGEISLPMFPALTNEQLEYVVQIISDYK